MTTHLLIMYSLPFCSLIYPPSFLQDTFLLESLIVALLSFISTSVLSYIPFSNTERERERSEYLVLMFVIYRTKKGSIYIEGVGVLLFWISCPRTLPLLCHLIPSAPAFMWASTASKIIGRTIMHVCVLREREKSTWPIILRYLECQLFMALW